MQHLVTVKLYAIPQHPDQQCCMAEATPQFDSCMEGSITFVRQYLASWDLSHVIQVGVPWRGVLPLPPLLSLLYASMQGADMVPQHRQCKAIASCQAINRHAVEQPSCTV
jgi:hypothetical protein